MLPLYTYKFVYKYSWHLGFCLNCNFVTKSQVEASIFEFRFNLEFLLLFKFVNIRNIFMHNGY